MSLTTLDGTPAYLRVGSAVKTRTAMGRRTGGALTPEYLALLAAEYRARGDEPERVYNMAEERRINRSTLWRHIQKAKEQGFL